MTEARDPQLGDRAPAPGPLALVQAFANSRWDLEHGLREQLSSPAELAAWLRVRGLLGAGVELGEEDLRRALAVREGLRALLFCNNRAEVDQLAVAELNEALRPAVLSVSLSAGRPPAFNPAGGGLDEALARITAVVVAAQLDGSWARMKACPGRGCGWVFYDHSRNRSSSWCSMAVCGQRHKARAYRARRRP